MTSQELSSRIESCQGMVRSIALAIYKRLNGVHGLDDLIAYGQLGLTQAAGDFDPSRGVQFSTYSYYRIRGAIYDGIGKMGWQRLTAHRDAAWNEILTNDAETNAQENTSESGDWLEGITERMATASLLTSSNEAQFREIADETASQPISEMCDQELRAKLHTLVDELPADMTQLVRQSYFQGLTLQEAATKLGISKSWASRMHAKALQVLGERLRRMGLAD